MKTFLGLVTMTITLLFSGTLLANRHHSDTVIIHHQVDGNLNEWTPAHFETDKESQIQYALDHDAGNLYLAMKVPNFRMQMKMMTQGMKLFIDKKGKRKEGTGIEFPVKREEGSGGFGGRGERGSGGEAGPPDPKEMRARLAANLIFLKTFGLSDQEDKTWVIGESGEIGLAYNWDDENNFYIEYQIPLHFLGDLNSLHGKPLGIGWKIMGMESSLSGPISSSSTLVGVPAGGGGGGRGGSAGRGAGSRAGGGANFGQDADSRFKDQNIWTKYILSL